MKFLLDVCTSSRSLIAVLTEEGHDVLSVLTIDPSASDDTLIALALEEDRILVTADKDFGELVFVRRLPHRTIIRFIEMTVVKQVAAMRELLGQYTEALQADAIIVVSPGRVRIRR